MKSLLIALVVCFAGACSGSQRAGGRGDEALWTRLETSHFVVDTDLHDARARELAQTLEDMRAALLASAWPGARGPGGKTRVVLFARPADFDRYSGASAMFDGVSIARPGFERVLAFSPGPEGGVPSIAVHELAHDLSHWFTPLQPTWFAEGMAVYLSNIRVDRERGLAILGEPPEDVVRWLRGTKTLMRSSNLFSAHAIHDADVRQVAAFYTSSWFLVMYLLYQEGEGFARFQRDVARLVPWKLAWDEAFAGMTTDELDENMIAFAETGHYFPIETALEVATIEPSVRPLSQAEVHGTLALLAYVSGQENAAREADAALALDADDLDALRVQSYLASAPDARLALARRALSAHPNAAEAWLLTALASEPGDEQRRALARAWALAPDHPGSAWLLAEDELRRGNSREALRYIRIAVRRSGLAPKMLRIQIEALGGLGRCAEAASLSAAAEALLGAECTVWKMSSGESSSCAAFVRAAYEGVRDSCEAVARAAKASPRGARR